MREFKFRGYCPKRKSLFQITEMNFRSNGMLSAVSPNQGEEFYPTKYEDENGVIVMQYTGLKDKNGVEIYEGDILQVSPVDKSLKNIFKKLGNVGIVKFSTKRFNYLWENGIKDECDKYSLASFQNKENYEIEVIGNIYENKELLKEN